MGPYVADFLNQLDKLFGFLANLTLNQIIITLVVGFVGLMIAKVIFTKGGPRQRMKGLSGAWMTIPMLVVVAGGVAWLVINYVVPGKIHL